MGLDQALQASAPFESKAQLEISHFSKYRVDLAATLGRDEYTGPASKGSNPPDLEATSVDGTSVGIELTQLMTRTRRFSNALTMRLLRRIVESGQPFRNLDGWTVFMWRYDGEATQGLPLADPVAERELIDYLAACDPREMVFSLPDGPLPTQIELPGLRLPKGFAFYTSGGSLGIPRTDAGSRFDLVLFYSETLYESELRADLLSRVATKDIPENDHLIIAIGGPEISGTIHRSEGLIFDLIFERGVPDGPRPRNLSLVRAHDWQSGRICELYPESSVLLPSSGDAVTSD
ncbi:MAG: hypothetical protein WEE67_03555 [Chloroflexota bacterium]